MKLTVNGEERELADEVTVANLLDELEVEQRRGMAVAKNQRVVPRARWDQEIVRDGDEIEIVRATQGG